MIPGMVLVCGLAFSTWCDASPSHPQHKHRHHVRRPIAAKSLFTSEEAFSPTAPKLDADEETHYEAVKEEAKTDPRIRELKEKADSAVDDEAARAATIAYYRALFQRIRETDKSLTERANLAEEAILRRFTHP